MREQRLQALQRLRANMGIRGPSSNASSSGGSEGNAGAAVRILPRDMEQGLKEFAAGVEQLVDKLVRTLCGLACQSYHASSMACRFSQACTLVS